MIRTPMMYILTGEDATNEAQMAWGVQDVANAGFDAICVEFRKSAYDEFDEVGRKAMHFLCEQARKNGIGFCKIMPHGHAEVLKRYPFLRRRVMTEIAACAEDGRLDVTLPERSGVSPCKIMAAYHIERDGQGRILTATDILPQLQLDAAAAQVTGPCPDGEVLLYPAYMTDHTDYAHPNFHLLLDAFLDIYKNYPLDGFALDEYGAGSREEGLYLANDSFLDRFCAKYGYDLLKEVYLLNHQGTDRRFGKVRHDYYKLSNDVTYDYQMLAKKKFTALYGKDIFIGFHNTWWGEGNSGDLWAGNIDYFQLSQALSGGFVDAQYDAERTMTSMNQLAESCARYTDTGAAYNMCWDRYNTPEKTEYFQRMLAVRNVNWVGHAYSYTYSKIVKNMNALYDFAAYKPVWGDIPRYVRREHAFSDFIGKAQAKAKIAVTYNWESCAYFNDDYMHYHRLTLKAILDKLMLHNIPVDVLPSEETDFSQYDYLFVLWPTMMVKEQWEAIKAAIAQDKQVIFIGPPAEITTNGEDIREEFEQIIGKEIVQTAEFMGGHEYIAWDLWFTEKRVHMPIYLDENKQMDYKNGNVRYYGYELPLTDLFFNILVELAPYQTVPSNQVISKAYYTEKESILAITARWQSKINERFNFTGHDIDIKNGVLVGIKFNGDKVEIISEPGAEIWIDGKLFDNCEL